MNLYESSEDYLERILMLSKTLDEVHSIDLAKSFNFSKPSISRAIKNLKEAEYIEVNPHGAITLTPKGYEVASKIYERHLLLTALLKHIGVSEEIAEKDACKVEHDLSDETFDKLKERYNLITKK